MLPISWQATSHNPKQSQSFSLDNIAQDVSVSKNVAQEIFGAEKTVEITNTQTTNQNNRAFTNLLSVQLYTAQNYNNNGPVHDSFGIHFAIENTNALTPVDAVKPMNFYENLGINHEGTILSFESREMPQVGEVFALYSSGYTKTAYILKLLVSELENTVFYIEDNFTGESVPFGTGVNTFSFTVDSSNPLSTATNRFSIRVDSIGTNYVYQDGVWNPENPNGISNPSDNILIVNGTASLNEYTEVNNLTIQEDGTLKVNSVLNLNGNITNMGNLIFTSSSSGNGELGAISPSSVIIGNATVHRYMKNKRSYRMVSSAVTTTSSIHDNWQEGANTWNDNPASGFGTHITGSTTDQLNGFDATITGNPSMFTVDVAAQQFVVMNNTNTNTLTAGNPYLLFVRGDRSLDLTDSGDNISSETILRATGTLASGPISQNFPIASNNDFVMFGNPYQSAVDISAVFSNSSSNNLYNQFYYVYDPSLGNHGAYVTIDLLDSEGTNTAGSTANKYLQAGQAAQVQVSGPATVYFEESNKAPGNFTSSNRSSISENNMITVQLYTTDNFNNNGAVHDSFGIIFGNDYDNNITSSDAIKPMNFYENLGIDKHSTYLSIERREMPEPDEVFSLYSAGYQHSEYTLKITVAGLENSIFYLEDHYTDTNTLLDAGETTYNFRVDANDLRSVSTSRFKIRTAQRLGVEDTNLLSNTKLYPNPLNGDTFYINTPNMDDSQLSVSICDITGRIIYKQLLDCHNNTLAVSLESNITTGVYLVTLKNNGTTQTYRLIIK